MIKLSTRVILPLLMASQSHGQVPATADSASAVKLLITFPEKADTVSTTRIRIAGCSAASAWVTVNEKAVRVYPSGAFVDRVDLNPGMNEIIIQAEDRARVTTDTLRIFRTPPMEITPRTPAQIDDRLIEPTVDIVLTEGDLLRLRFKGSPGGTARFSIDKLCKNVPLTELTPDDAEGMVGIYQGMIRVRTTKSVSPTRVKYELRSADGKKAKAESRGMVSVLASVVPLVCEVVEETYMWNAPQGGAILGVIPEEVRIEIMGKIGQRYKVRLSPHDVVWVSGEDIRLLPRGTAVPRATVGSASYSVLSDRIRLAVSINDRLPFKVEQSLDPAELYLYLYGAHQGSQWMTYPERDQTVRRVSWSQPSENVYCLHVELNQKQQWGYRVFYEEGRLNFDIRKAPEIAKPPRSPVAGLIFALDPGHGGDEPGAVGPTGLEEKAVNLTFAKKLASLLRDAGAEVVLTREDDSTVSLRERVKIAREARAHIFVMMHNNSVGAASDPMIRGTSTYYTQPHSQELAWTVYPRLKQIGLAPFGKVFSSYYITRQTDMLYFLVEGAFMSNPEDEMLLMDEVFIGKMAKAVLDGIEDFLKKQVE